jgi:di/tripeptidase
MANHGDIQRMSSKLINRDRLLDRFLKYVRVGTTADPNTNDYPSSRGQWLLGQMLVEQLREMGIEDALQDDHGLVWGTIPATVPGPVPTILFNAHLDTSPEAPGDHCKPQVIECYEGGDIPLLSGDIIREQDTPELAKLLGHTLITTDGKTLLGGDDKAGVAAIMELAHHLMENRTWNEVCRHATSRRDRWLHVGRRWLWNHRCRDIFCGYGDSEIHWIQHPSVDWKRQDGQCDSRCE